MGETEKLQAQLKKPISAYQVVEMFKGMGKLIERFPAVLSNSMDEAVEMGTKDAISRMARCFDSIRQFDEILLAKNTEIDEAYDALWKTVRDKRDEISKKIDDLPKIPEFTVPYEIVKLIDIAERCSNLSDEAWTRVVELAKALAK